MNRYTAGSLVGLALLVGSILHADSREGFDTEGTASGLVEPVKPLDVVLPQPDLVALKGVVKSELEKEITALHDGPRIQWIATESAGDAEMVGSRLFSLIGKSMARSSIGE